MPHRPINSSADICDTIIHSYLHVKTVNKILQYNMLNIMKENLHICFHCKKQICMYYKMHTIVDSDTCLE